MKWWVALDRWRRLTDDGCVIEWHFFPLLLVTLFRVKSP
jgi:hypothetical protein